MIKEMFYLILLALAFPSGIYLAKVCKEEIVKWRVRMILISALCFMMSISLLISSFQYKFAYFVGLFFIIITFLTIVWKSYK